MHGTTRPLSGLALTLGLLVTPAVACDIEPEDQLDAELEADYAAIIERRLELEEGVELKRVTELELSADGSEETIRWIEVTDLTSSEPVAGTCGWGHWEWKSTRLGCGTCELYGQEGKKDESYKRWCWDGPPSCGGCGGWQYVGWACHFLDC